MTRAQSPREFLSETFSRAVVDGAIRSRQHEGWELTYRRDNDDGKSTTVAFQRPMAPRPSSPEPMNTKARNRCLEVLDASEDAWLAFQNLRELVESNDVKNVRRIRHAVDEIDSWLFQFKMATLRLSDEDT